MTAHLHLLTDAQRRLLADLRALLSDVRVTLARLGAAADDQAALARSLRQLDDFFLIVVVGEFNAGKSAFINALLGDDVAREGVTPTTARVTVLRFGTAGEARVNDEGVAEITAPADLLRHLHLVDTPGTNAVLREHEQLTTGFVPRADLVVFVTSADRPFTETERAFMERIRAWGKKVVVAINKRDILEREQLAEVVAFVTENARGVLGVNPLVFAVSARDAKQGKAGDEAAWAASGFEALERYLTETLDQAERVRLKMRNPLGVATRATTKLHLDVGGRLEVLARDETAVMELERHIETYAADTHRDFAFRWADIEKVFNDMERRGHDHFDETIRLGRMMDLLHGDRVRAQFEQQVVADTPHRVERKVQELIDWLVASDFAQWQSLTERLAERRASHRDRAPAVPTPGFQQDRARIIETIGREARQVVDAYDQTREAAQLAEKARASVATSAALEVGAAGLGAVVAAVATTAAADVTGLAMAGVLATVGLLIIPNRRRQAKRELREKVSALRQRLATSLRGAVEDELRRGVSRLRQQIQPFSQFVRSEATHLSAARDELDTLVRRMAAVADRIDTV